MSKLGLFVTIMSIVGVLTLGALSASGDDTAKPCVRTDFKTELVKQACSKGGQAEAKAAMKAFAKERGIKSCNQCHETLAPQFELKPDGFEQFQKAGGK
jgi:hypothetical protein